MKRICAVGLIVLLTAMAWMGLAEPSQRKLTILVYMCGSNLESGYGSASADLAEMMSAKYDAKQVSLLVMTGGTSAWATGYDAGVTQILELNNNKSRVVWSGEPMNMGDAGALTTLLRFGQERNPDSEYALILWNHGGGPLEGVCWDELFSMDSLTLPELIQALEEARLPRKLSWIGFDACLMGSAEVAAAVSPYAEYMIASQETEPAQGWNYAFLNAIEADANGAETGRRIVDTYFETETNAILTLACIDLSKIESIQNGLDAFFSPIEQNLTSDSFDLISDIRLSATGFGKAVRGLENQGYDLVDLHDLVDRYNRNTNGNRVLTAIDEAVVYNRANIEGASGLSVYHPFDNKKDYLQHWRDDYHSMSFSRGYIRYIDRFAAILTGETLADWSGLKTDILTGGDTQYILQLTADQQKAFVDAQLVILAAQDLSNGVYGTQVTALEGSSKGQTVYSPVYVMDAPSDENGTISAAYAGRALYAVNEEGTPVLGPLSYQISEDGTILYVHGYYQDRSGRENFVDNLSVMFGVAFEETDDDLRVVSVRGYDSATKTYSSRIPVDENAYTHLQFYPETREMPDDPDNLTGFDAWVKHNTLNLEGDSIRLPMAWRFRFFQDQMSASQLYAAIQVTDSQRETHMTRPVAIVNPNLEDVAISPRVIETDEVGIRIFFLKDRSPMHPGLNLVLEATNLSKWTENVILEHILLNDTQVVCPDEATPIYISKLAPYETKVDILHIEQSALTGLDSVTSLTADVWVQALNHGIVTDETMRFEVDNCDLRDIAPDAAPPLAEARDKGLIWSLISLERNEYGDIAGVLHVLNNTEQPVEGFLSLAVNGLFIDGTDSIILEAPIHSEAYIPFKIEDAATLKAPLTLNGRRHWYWMTIDNAMSRYGLNEIRDLEIYVSYATSVPHYTTLSLREPWPIPGAIQSETTEGKPLMTGKVEASLERVLLADNGVGLRLVFTNHSERVVGVAFGRQTLNGKTPERNAAPNLLIPARGRAVYTFSITDDGLMERGERITDVGMAFQLNGEFSTRPVFIRIHPSAEAGYLAPADYDTEPMPFDQPDFVIANPGQRVDDKYALTVDGVIVNGNRGAVVSEWFDTEQTYLQLNLRLMNLTPVSQYYTFSNFVINGERVTDAHWLINEVESGGSAVSQMTIDMTQLRGIDEIMDVSCEMSYHEPGRYDDTTTVPLRFDVENCDVSAYTPERFAPLAADNDGLLDWELLSVTLDENDGLDVLLHVLNPGDETVGKQMVYMAIDGYCTGWFMPTDLQAGMDQYLTVSFTNEIRIPSYEIEVYQSPYSPDKLYYPLESHVLEQRGIHSVSQIQLFSDLHYYGENPNAGRVACLELSEPIPLTVASDVADARQHPFIADELSLYQGDMLVGDNGVALSIDIVNGTNEIIELTPTEVCINGLPCECYKSYNSVIVMPNTASTTYISILTKGHDDVLQTGTLIRGISVSLKTQTGMSFSGVILLDREAPLGASGGVFISGDEMYSDVSRAESLIQTTADMAAQTAFAVRLAPALDDRRLALFESGTASVMAERSEPYAYRDGADPQEEYEFLPVRQRIAMAELVRDGEGVVSARFSGLAWVNAQEDPLEYYAIDLIDEENDYIAAVGIALFDDPEAPFTLDPTLSLDDSAYIYSLTAAYLIHLEDNHPEIAGYLTEAYTPSGDEVTEQALADNAIALGAAETMAVYLRGDDVVGSYYERLPLISQEDLRFISIDDLPGAKYVYYEINYADGSSESFFEPYPYHF